MDALTEDEIAAFRLMRVSVRGPDTWRRIVVGVTLEHNGSWRMWRVRFCAVICVSFTFQTFGAYRAARLALGPYRNV
jgi:hypothetical protein